MFSLKTNKLFVYGLIICVLLIFSIFRVYYSSDSVRGASGIVSPAGEFSCDSDVKYSNKRNRTSNFPHHIHQIFFFETDLVMPDILESARKTWIRRQRRFRYTLWNATMIEDLIITKYPSLLKVYQSYTHWVRRADMARYVVLYEHGGVYVDIDIRSKRKSLHDLLSSLKNTSGIALYASSLSFVSNDFMIAKPKHPFMKSVLCGLEAANKWYILPFLTTMMSTGPMYLDHQFKKYEPKSDIELIPLRRKLLQYITHITGAAWHQWDSQIIWWIYVHRKKFIKRVTLAIIFLSICILLIRKYRTKTHRLHT